MPVARRPTLLSIEDEAGVQRLIQRTLETFCDVRVASSGEAGVHDARLLKPDLILLDLRMPGMDGLTVLAQLKGHQETSGIPVVIVSALGDTHMMMEGQRAGAIDHLIKPFEPEHLRRMVRRHLFLEGDT